MSLDTPERALYCGTTKAGGKTNFGCYRCRLKYQQLIDPNINAFDYIRSRFDFNNMINKYQNATRSNFSSKTGYSSLQYNRIQIDDIENIHFVSTVDINHDTKNKIEQLDQCIKKSHLSSNVSPLYVQI